MKLTLLEAVTAINDAVMLIDVLTPLVAKVKAAGLGDADEIPDAELDAHAAAVGANIASLRATIAALSAPAP
jgi:hypothetical protein